MGSCAASPRDLAYPMAQADGSTLLVELLYEQETGLDESRLLAEVNTVLPRTVLAGDDRQPTLLVHEGYGEVDPGGAAVPIMSVLMPADNGDHLSDPARIDLSQTWEFPQAQAVLDRCRAALTIGEMFGRPRLPTSGSRSSARPSWRPAASPCRWRRGGPRPPSSFHRHRRMACR
jgi:hypothetical protein